MPVITIDLGGTTLEELRDAIYQVATQGVIVHLLDGECIAAILPVALRLPEGTISHVIIPKGVDARRET